MNDEKTAFEAQVDALNDALSNLPTPDPPSARQVIIACRPAILAKIRTHGWRDVHKAIVDSGHDISIGTLKDYVYKGEVSKPGRTAKKAITERNKRQPAERVVQPEPKVPVSIGQFTLPDDATEATARGAPVLGRKLPRFKPPTQPEEAPAPKGLGLRRRPRL